MKNSVKFQFTLQEIILLLSTCVLGSVFLAPYLECGFWRLQPDKEALANYGVTLLVVGSGGGLVGLGLAAYYSWKNWLRTRIMLAGIFISWLPLLFVASSARVASNEAAAIKACQTFAEAQDIYRRTDWDGDGILEYAQAISGAHSLFEHTIGKGDLCLLDRTFAQAEGLPAIAIPRKGYVFKVLKGQGSQAPGGRKSYLASWTNGEENLNLGYALIASPAEYGITGINSFIINNTGTVFSLDLGPNTAKMFEQMTEYNPPLVYSCE